MQSQNIISGTQVNHFKDKKMVNRIAITGPESTGKSELAEQLARYYHTIWVEEFARKYIDHLYRAYTYHDILIIAQQQLKNENSAAEKANRLLFCDSDFTVTKIWCEFKYGKCHPWIVDQFKNHRYDLYLLCGIDIPWSPDPQREHPDQRKTLFNLYKKELMSAHFPFKIINGLGGKRLENAIEIVDQMLNLGIK